MRLDMLSSDAFKKLTSDQEGPLVSLYMPLGEGSAHENLKHLTLALSEVEVQLGAMGLSPKGCVQFLASARAYAEQQFTVPHGGKTLAVLLSPSAFHAFMLPSDVPQIIHVGSQFCVAPLLPYLRKNAECYVLAVSKDHARLLHIGSDGIEEVEVADMPHSFDEAFAGTEHQDKELQSHSASGAGGNGAAVFHGKGGASDLEKKHLEEYMHKIAKCVDHALNEQKAPLFFAGVEEEFGMYRKYAAYAHLHQHFIHGNPDSWSAEDLYDKAIDLLRPLWDKEREVALEVYGPLSGTGRTSTEPQAILDLSYHGKVEGLLVAEDALQWGSIDTENGIAEVHSQKEAGDSDLMGLAAIHTLQHKGWVRALSASQMPEGSSLAAILRY